MRPFPSAYYHHRHSEPVGRRNPEQCREALDSYALRALNDGDNNKHSEKVAYTSVKIENSVIKLANFYKDDGDNNKRLKKNSI